MANPLLRRYNVSPTAANTNTTLVAAVPAGRALAISKIVASAYGAASGHITISVAGAGIANALPLVQTEVYTESGLVLQAGETIIVQSSAANAVMFSVFGEEVDNT